MNFRVAFVESKTNNVIQETLLFLENSVADSVALKTIYRLLDRFYPERIFNFLDAANKRQKSYLSKNVFSPLVIFPLVYIFFVSISNYRLSNTALFSIASGLFFFYLGAKFSRHRFKEIKFNEQTKKIGLFFFVTGLIFLLADLVSAEAIPLFFPSARSRLVVTYTMIAQLLPPGGVLLIAYVGERYHKGMVELKTARIYAFSIFFITLLLISTLGFRTQIMVTLLGSLIVMFLTGLLGFVEVALSLILAGGGIVFLGYMRAVIQGSPIGFFNEIGARVGLTLSVYDYLVERFMPFGANKGYTFLASFSSFIPGLPGPKLGPRTIVARLFDITGISVTSTLLGTIVLDFGIVGVVFFMFILGYILWTGYTAAKTGFAMGVGIYSVLLAYSIVGIETGLVDFNVIMMFVFGYLLLRKSAEA